MRTNQERAAEVFKRAAVYQTNHTQQRDSVRNQWSQSWVRALASVLVGVILFGTGVGLFFGLKDAFQNRIDNFDKMYIANFANYKAIGAGGVGTTADQILQPQALNVAAVNSNDQLYLVGVDKDNNIERCRVSRDNRHGKNDSVAINYQVKCIYAFERYTFVSFWQSDWPAYSSNRFECSLFTGTEERAYVIDNKTGKFYALNIFDYDGAYLQFQNLGSFGYDGYESADGVFARGTKMLGDDVMGNAIYKIYLENDQLVMKEVFDYSLGLNLDHYYVDKFGNIYLSDTHSYQVRYILSNGKLIQPTKIGLDSNVKFFRSLNGICYTGDGTKYINADGQLVDNDFTDCGYFFEKAEKVKSVNNVDYYYRANDSYYKTSHGLFQVTWENEVEFSVEKIEYSRPVEIKAYVVTKDYIYIIEENEISKIEITTGNIEPLNSDYIFTAIQTDYLGNVIFNGNDVTMNKIVGIITNDGEITILTKPRDYQIYYITAVNQ